MPHHKDPNICPICSRGKEFSFIEDYSDKKNLWSLYECRECLAQFWEPFKNQNASQYEEDVDYSDKVSILNSENAEIIVQDCWNMDQFLKNDLFQNGKGKKLLDAACGTGEFCYIAKKRGCDVIGVDFNSNAIKLAQKSFPNIEFVSQDIFSFLDNHKKEYDIITAFEILEHLGDPARFVKRASESLKDDGYLVISAPNRKRWFSHISFNNEPWDFPYQHMTRWDKQSLENIIKNNQLSKIEIKEEIPSDLFLFYIKNIISWIKMMTHRDSFNPIVEIRSSIGINSYKKAKNIIKIITFPFAIVFFYLFGLKGVHMNIIAKR